MQVLEKILQEIEDFKRQKYDPRQSKSIDELEILCLDKIANIIHPCMKDDGWIPVEEKLPDEGQKVWVTLKYENGFSEIRGSIFKEGDFWENKYIVYINVIAWMPRFIPMPYQPKEEKQ